jgi:uncharacterized protein YjiS (DUF1127 family)
MSTCSPIAMTNRHDKGTLGQFGKTFATWLYRYQSRRELARWSNRDLHDIGLSWSDVADEVDKPFWRA